MALEDSSGDRVTLAWSVRQGEGSRQVDHTIYCPNRDTFLHEGCSITNNARAAGIYILDCPRQTDLKIQAMGFELHLIKSGSQCKLGTRTLTPNKSGALRSLRKQQARIDWQGEAGGRKAEESGEG